MGYENGWDLEGPVWKSTQESKEPNVEDEAIEEQDGEHEDDTYENPDADLEPVLELKVSESMLTEQSSCSSPNRLQVAVEEETEEDAADIQAIKEEVCQLPDLDADMKGELDDEQEENEQTVENEGDEGASSEPLNIPQGPGRGVAVGVALDVPEDPED